MASNERYEVTGDAVPAQGQPVNEQVPAPVATPQPPQPTEPSPAG